MINLEGILRINALFSFATGGLLLGFPKWIASLFGQTESDPVWIIGLLLVIFSITVLYESLPSKRRRRFVLFIIAQDILWVLGSILLVVWDPLELSLEGKLITLIVATIVAMFAIGQFIGLRRRESSSMSFYKG